MLKLDTRTDKERIASLRRRVSRARKFPTNTCGSSRHLHMMADALLDKGRYAMLEDEPAHCAESILNVLESLWKLRTASPEYAKEIEKALARIRSETEPPQT